MTQPAKVQEPSMEEILASIRRIIADDEAKPAEAKAPAAEKPSSPPAPAKPDKLGAAAPAAKAPVMNDSGRGEGDSCPGQSPASAAACSRAQQSG
jgi:cell pole-organizing protein PopZ